MSEPLSDSPPSTSNNPEKQVTIDDPKPSKSSDSTAMPVKNSETTIGIQKSETGSPELAPEKPVPKWYQRITVHNFLSHAVQALKRATAFPMVSSDAIYFDEDDRFDPSGNKRYDATNDNDDLIYPMGEKVEVKVNYERATKEMFEAIIKYRKEAKNAKDNYFHVSVDLAQYPGWTDAHIDRLRSTFQVFDLSGDGLVDYEEFSTVLEEFGDTSSPEIRNKYFSLVNDGSGFVDFMEFLKLVHTVTIRTDDPLAQELSQSFHSIDRNMARVRSLDVVQQLQAGLF